MRVLSSPKIKVSVLFKYRSETQDRLVDDNIEKEIRR